MPPGPGPRGRRRGLGQDPGAHAPARLPRRRARRVAVRDPRDHVHQQGRGRDARAGRRAGRPGRAAHVGVDVPRRVLADPAPRGVAARLPVELHDLRPGRRAAPHRLDPPRPQPRPEAVPGPPAPRADQRAEERARAAGRVRGRWPSARPSAGSPRSTPSTSAGCRRRRRSTSTTCSCSRCACSASTPKRSSATASASGTCSSTSSRTRTPRSGSSCACSPRSTAASWSWVTSINASSPAPRSRWRDRVDEADRARRRRRRSAVVLRQRRLPAGAGAARAPSRERSPGVSISLASGRQLVSTPEHMHFAGYVIGRTPQLHMTYLMWKQGVGFRVGTSRTYTKGQAKAAFGPALRCNGEGGDAVWVIGTHATDAEARLHEATLAARYGLPTLPFKARPSGAVHRSLVGDQALIDRLFASLDTEKAGTRSCRRGSELRLSASRRARAHECRVGYAAAAAVRGPLRRSAGRQPVPPHLAVRLRRRRASGARADRAERAAGAPRLARMAVRDRQRRHGARSPRRSSASSGVARRAGALQRPPRRERRRARRRTRCRSCRRRRSVRAW